MVGGTKVGVKWVMITAKECNKMLAGEMVFHVCKRIAYK
jgi:hypothetical protein